MKTNVPSFMLNSLRGHLETIIPYLTYPIYQVDYERERLELSDGDFLDIDWVKGGNDRLLIISHAFEGNARDYFVERSAKYFAKEGYDVLVWHFRSCSREINRLPYIYNFSDVSDLTCVVMHAQALYSNLYLLGFSMGAVTMLNYLAGAPDDRICAAAAVSAPLDIAGSFECLNAGLTAYLYGRAFYKKLKKKLLKKASQYPHVWRVSSIERAQNLSDLVVYMQQVYGVKESYFKEISPLYSLNKIVTPTLIINAKNDPILSSTNYPDVQRDTIETMYPTKGGHCGFAWGGSKDAIVIEQNIHHFFLK